MALEPQDRTQTVREWLELVMPSQVKPPDVIEPSKLPTTIVSAKTAPEKPVNIPQAPQTPRNNSPGKIQTRKFEFEYAKIEQKVLDNGFLGFGRKVDNIEIKRYRGEAEGFTEDLGKGVILEMVKIPGGSFIMGAPEDEKKSRDNERPQHQVNIQAFFMGKFQVTQEQYKAITGKNPSRFRGKKRSVERVNWYDAVEFCKKLSQLTGKEYRLPSEAEWEYACRAGTTTPFHFGETITSDLANYNGNYTYGAAPKGVHRKETTDVGSFPSNSFGLYDMHGNVWEWCLDDWHNNYKGATIDGSAWVEGTSDNNNRYQVLRGGSWYNNPENCRSACRYNYSPAYRSSNYGFRLVCDVARRT